MALRASGTLGPACQTCWEGKRCLGDQLKPVSMTPSVLFPEDWDDNGPVLPSGSSAQGSCCGTHSPVSSVDSGAPGSNPVSQLRVYSKSTVELFWELGVSHPRGTCEEGISGKDSFERRLSIFLYPRLSASQLKNLSTPVSVLQVEGSL